MKFCLVLALSFFACSYGMLYRRDADLLRPDLQAVSSTVMPLPYYSVFGYEKRMYREKYKQRPQGKITLVTKPPE